MSYRAKRISGFGDIFCTGPGCGAPPATVSTTVADTSINASNVLPFALMAPGTILCSWTPICSILPNTMGSDQKVTIVGVAVWAAALYFLMGKR
jgi:hypothetical protein